MRDRVAAAVLCGGASRRMGADKAIMAVEGVAMATRVAAAASAAGCWPVFAVGGDAAALDALGLDVVTDEFPGEGPLGGVITAIAHAAEIAESGADGVDGVFVVACDLPYLPAGVVERVTEALGAHDVAYAMTDRPEPLCAVWKIGVLPELRRRFASGDRAVVGVLDLFDSVAVELPIDGLRNVNTPDDLDLLR